MEDLTTIARPYAQAALSQAQTEDDVAGWGDMLEFLAALARDPTLSGVIANPSVETSELTRLLLDVAGDRLSATGTNFVRLLAANHRLAALSEIQRQFERLRADLEGRLQVDIVSAYELSDGQADELAAAVARRLGRQVDVTSTVDSALIGGVIIRAGDLAIDASMRGRLAQMGAALGVAA